MSLEEAGVLEVVVGKGLAKLDDILLADSIDLQNCTFSLSADFLRDQRLCKDRIEVLDRQATEYE